MTLLQMTQLVAVVLALAGCQHQRIVYVSPVSDSEAPIQTRYRYRVFTNAMGYREMGLGKGSYDQKATVEFMGLRTHECTSEFARYQPGVFAKDGIPILFEDKTGGGAMSYQECPSSVPLQLLSFPFALTTAPFLMTRLDRLYRMTLSLYDEKANVGREKLDMLEIYLRRDQVFGPPPWGFAFFRDQGALQKELDGCKFVEVRHNDLDTDFSLRERQERNARREVTAYTLASKLKELEESGRMSHLAAEFQTEGFYQRRFYRVVKLEKDAGDDFEYLFELAAVSDLTVKSRLEEIKDDLRYLIRTDYKRTHRMARTDSLPVEFTSFERNGRTITGKATILAIRPRSLDYDAVSKVGVIVVGFTQGQEQAACDWVRKNVDVLARDKNLLLETGKLPTDAKVFYESVEVKDGSVSVRFRTE